MSDHSSPAIDTRRARRTDAPSARKARVRRKWAFVVGGVVLGALGATATGGVFLYNRAMDIQAELTEAQRLIPSAMASAKTLDLESVDQAYATIAGHTAEAVRLTDDPLWSLAQDLPWAGTTFAAVTDLASITDDTVVALRPILDVAPALIPENLTPVDGAFPVAALASAAEAVSTTAESISGISERVAGVEVEGAIAQVVDAKSTLVGAIADLDQTLGTVDTIVSVVPTLLGVNGEKRYLLVFQNNAEALGLGGSSASQTLVTAREGKIEIAEQESSQTYAQERVDVPLPDSAFALYGEYYAKRINLTPSRPDWPSDAQILKAFWQRDIDSGPVDGVASIDPLALARILKATGPVEVMGTEVNSDNAVRILLNEVYHRFDSTSLTRVNEATDAFFAETAAKVFEKLSGGQFDVLTMFDAFTASVDSGSIMYWTEDKQVATLLSESQSRITGVLPTTNDQSTTVGVYFRDTSSSKIDYYMDSSVDVSTTCMGDEMTMTVTARLRLDLTLQESVNLPTYVRSGGWKGTKYRTQVFMYAPPGMTIAGVDTEGASTRPFRTGNRDLSREVAPFEAVHVPGEEFAVSATFTGPSSSTPTQVRTTPMIRTTEVSIHDGCIASGDQRD